MAHQVVKYRLTAEGTIPEFIYFGNDGLHGYYGTYPTGADAQPSPRDLVQIGITDNGATGDFEVVASQADLTAYLTSISDGWTQMAPTNEDPMASEPFDPATASAWVWGVLDTLNAAA